MSWKTYKFHMKISFKKVSIGFIEYSTKKQLANNFYIKNKRAKFETRSIESNFWRIFNEVTSYIQCHVV